METPQGDLIKESGVIAQFATEYSQEGYELIPKNPVDAAKMRLKIEECGNLLKPFYAVYMSRGQDPEVNKGLIPTIEAFDSMIAKANGKFLFGTEQPTMLDVFFAPFLETFYDWRAPSVMSNVLADCEFDTRGSHIGPYIEMFRALPEIRQNYMITEAGRAHWERTRGWQAGVKCQLWTGYLEQAYKEAGWE